VDAIAARYIDEERLTAEVDNIVAQAQELAVQYRRLAMLAQAAEVDVAPWPFGDVRPVVRSIRYIIEPIMRAHDGPMTVAQIVDAANERGVALNGTSVRSALYRLRNIRQAQPGLWTLTS
jgi:hypothetical protein